MFFFIKIKIENENFTLKKQMPNLERILFLYLLKKIKTSKIFFICKNKKNQIKIFLNFYVKIKFKKVLINFLLYFFCFKKNF